MRGQFSSATYFNRYPQNFSAAKQICDEESRLRRPLRILSYGCSLGEELLSLRLYFPEAELFGCDINEDVLNSGADIAKQANATVFKSADASILEHGPFDIVTAMSVLCRHPAIDIERYFPFSAFEHNIGIIDESLAPEGLLVLYNASYLFRGSVVSRHYQPIRPDTIGSNGFTTRHGRMADVVAKYVYSDLEATYRIGDLSRIRFEDFID